MMTRREAHRTVLSGAILAAAPGLAQAATLPIIDLPAPQTSGGKPLMQTIAERRSIRNFAPRPLPATVLSNLLWAAYGINRPESGDRTAPSWRHFIALEIHLATAEGVWRYEPKAHRLLPQRPGDIRAATGSQDFVAQAPLNLIYVADGKRMDDTPPAEQQLYARVDAAFIGQNVYLFAASAGLASVFRGALNAEKLGQILDLPPSQFVTFAQSVGYPA